MPILQQYYEAHCTGIHCTNCDHVELSYNASKYKYMSVLALHLRLNAAAVAVNQTCTLLVTGSDAQWLIGYHSHGAHKITESALSVRSKQCCEIYMSPRRDNNTDIRRQNG